MSMWRLVEIVERVYKFECNAGDKNLYLIYPYNVYVDSNHNDIWDEGDENAWVAIILWCCSRSTCT